MGRVGVDLDDWRAQRACPPRRGLRARRRTPRAPRSRRRPRRSASSRVPRPRQVLEVDADAAASAARSSADWGEPSPSTQARFSLDSPPPWKIQPEHHDEDERERQRPEQGCTVAGVAPDIRDGQRPQGSHLGLVSPAMHDRSGWRNTSSSERPADGQGSAARPRVPRPAASSAPIVAPTSRVKTKRRQRRPLRTEVTAGNDSSSAYVERRLSGSKRTARSLKCLDTSWLDRAQLEDLAVVHDRQSVAQDLGLLHVVGREEDARTSSLEPSRRASHRERRAAGSRPVVGSSRNTSSGSLTRASATANRWRCPPDRSFDWALLRSVEPERLDQLGRRPRLPGRSYETGRSAR